MDMREMVNKVKTGQPLYGNSTVTPYLQGVAARNSRYSELFIHVLPWFNLVNHDQVRSPVIASLGMAVYMADSSISTASTPQSTINKPKGSSKRNAWERPVLKDSKDKLGFGTTEYAVIS